MRNEAVNRGGHVQLNRNPMLRNAMTLTTVVVGLGTAVALYFSLFGTAFIQTISELTAESSAFTLNLFGADVRTAGTIVASDRFAYNIVAECTAVGPLVLYIGAVLVFPAALRAKLIGSALGLFFIGGLNIVRLVSLFYIGSYAPEQLDLFHLLIWQGVMILSVVMLWLYWVRRWGNARSA
jgi:exosortase H (IPTLxxWG-CTERM-specific)